MFNTCLNSRNHDTSFLQFKNIFFDNDCVGKINLNTMNHRAIIFLNQISLLHMESKQNRKILIINAFISILSHVHAWSLQLFDIHVILLKCER